MNQFVATGVLAAEPQLMETADGMATFVMPKIGNESNGMRSRNNFVSFTNNHFRTASFRKQMQSERLWPGHFRKLCFTARQARSSWIMRQSVVNNGMTHFVGPRSIPACSTKVFSRFTLDDQKVLYVELR